MVMLNGQSGKTDVLRLLSFLALHHLEYNTIILYCPTNGEFKTAAKWQVIETLALHKYQKYKKLL